MLTNLTAIVLGAVEGLTEFLPISSTAHLTLTAQIMGLDQSAFVKTFEIAIQSGAILAVIVLYWRRFLDVAVLKRVLAAFIPTAIIGLILYKLVKEYLIGNIAVTLWALAIGGLALIVFEKWFKTKPESDMSDIRSLSYGKSVLVGLVQAISIIPGVSRSAATIIGGLFCGLSREAVVEFSFLLAVPTVLAATGLDLFRSAGDFHSSDFGLLAIGFIAAFVAAILAIKFLLNYLKKHTFTGFGVYRILVVLIFVVVLYL